MVLLEQEKVNAQVIPCRLNQKTLLIRKNALGKVWLMLCAHSECILTTSIVWLYIEYLVALEAVLIMRKMDKGR